MKFLELKLENFGPYRGKQTINLNPEIDGTNRPIILFGGMNGGGKTTLMDAIRLALYGIRAQCSTRGNLSYNDFLAQCVNRHSQLIENARIELVFEHVEDGKLTKYRIVRYWDKQPKEGKDTLGIVVYDELGQEWPDKGLVSTWDEYIETLLPLGISNLFLFDGEQVKELAEMETPPDFVVGAIKSLLGLELTERLAADLEILLNRKRKDIAGERDKETLDKIEAKFKQLNEEKTAAKQEEYDANNQLEIAQKKYKVAQDKFISEGGKIAANRSQLDLQLKDLKERTDKTRQSLIELSAGVLPLQLIYPLLEQGKNQAEIEAKQHQAKVALGTMHDRNKRLIDYITELGLNEQQFDNIKSFIATENHQLEQDAVAGGKPWLHADEDTINQTENLLKYELKAQKNAATEKLAELKQIEIDIDATDRQLAAAASPEAYEQLETAIRQAQKEVSHAKIACESAKRRLLELDREIAKTQKQLEDYSNEYLKQRNTQHLITSIARSQNTLKQFREKLTLKKLNKLEVEVTECFRYLLHKSDLVHRVVIDTHTFALSLYDPQGQPVAKHRISAGEKQLLAIAFLWGLARVSGRNLPIAIDTPLGRLDSSHRQNLVDRYFTSASHQVILLSTDTEITENEVKKLRENEAIAREYLLKYDSSQSQTTVEEGYFW